MAQAKSRTVNPTLEAAPRKTLSLRKETLKDLSPIGRDVRGGVSGSGGSVVQKFDRKTMPIGASANTAASTM